MNLNARQRKGFEPLAGMRAKTRNGLLRRRRSKKRVAWRTRWRPCPAPVASGLSLTAVKGNGLKPALITCEREEDQTDFVVEKVLEHNESGLGLRR